MPRKRIYATNAERQYAYDERKRQLKREEERRQLEEQKRQNNLYKKAIHAAGDMIVQCLGKVPTSTNPTECAVVKFYGNAGAKIYAEDTQEENEIKELLLNLGMRMQKGYLR